MKNEENEERKQKVLDCIMENYKQIEKAIVEQLYMKHTLHGTTIGSQREEIWKQLFEMVLPKKFVIEQSVFIIDALNGVSNEVDLAILDETYTPYIFRYGRLKFIPIEAVAVVVECKSQIINDNTVQTILTWSDNIKKLKTSKDSVVRMANDVFIGPAYTQKSTRPIQILCSLETNLKLDAKEKLGNIFDFIIIASNKPEKNPHIDVEIPSKCNNLLEWYEELNFYNEQNTYKKDGIEKIKARQLNEYRINNSKKGCLSLLSLNFQLNQLLMLINNPMLFPHRDYVRMFNDEDPYKKEDN